MIDVKIVQMFQKVKFAYARIAEINILTSGTVAYVKSHAKSLTTCKREQGRSGIMVRIKNKNGSYLCLAWASKDADKAFELTEELCAKVMLAVGIDNCIIEEVETKDKDK